MYCCQKIQKDQTNIPDFVSKTKIASAEKIEYIEVCQVSEVRFPMSTGTTIFIYLTASM